MIEERSTRLLVALEGRADSLLEALQDARSRRATLAAQLDELQHQQQALETRNAELLVEVSEGQARQATLEQQLADLQARLADAEASGMELLEENRELDEQNRELEAHNRHLREERESAAETGSGALFQRRVRPAQGLSALMGQRSRAGEVGAPPLDGARDSQPVDDARSVSDRQPGPDADAPSASAQEAPRHDTAESSPESQSSLPSIDEAPSPQALLEQWYQRYPQAFFKGHTRPLQVGIHETLAAREPWPEKLVRRALACYVNLPRYLKSVREGAERIDIDGQPAEAVDAGAAEHARKKIERLQAHRRAGNKTARRKAPDGKGGKAGKGGEARSPRKSAIGTEQQRQRASDSAADVSTHHAGRAVDTASTASQTSRDERSGEPSENRMQRKLSELMARHNAE